MVTAFEFLPAIAPAICIVRVAIVYSQCLEKLKKAYQAEGSVVGPPQRNSSVTYAWSVFQPALTDSSAIVSEKEKLRKEVRERLRYTVLLFFGGFFGLAIFVIVLESIFK